MCSECHDGFWTRASENQLKAESAEHRARYDSERVVASRLMSVAEASQVLGVTPQSVHKKMLKGQIDYVFAGELRLPLRESLMTRREVPTTSKRKVPLKRK